MNRSYGTRFPRDEDAADRIVAKEKPGATREPDGRYLKEGKEVARLAADPNSGSLRLEITESTGDLHG